MRQGAFRLACAAQALIVAIGGGVAAARESGHHASRTALKVTTRPVADGHNTKEQAQREADWLLSVTRLPEGAHALRRPPRILSGPILGTPAVSSLVIRSGYWRVPMSYSATLAWLRAHPPRELTLSGWGGGVAGPDGSASGYVFSDVPTASWQSADLEVGVTADGDGSAIRADATVVWLDPKPVRDDGTGARLHVTADGTCPSNDRGVVGVRNDGERLSDQLLPDAQPKRALVCRYAGLNGNRFGLLAATRLDGTHARALAEAIRRLPLSHTDGGITSCPGDDGGVAIVALSYAGSADVDLWVALEGCAFVSNGQIVTGAGPVRELILHLR